MLDKAPDPRLFTREQVAAMLNVSVRTIGNLIDRGMLDRPLDAGGPKWAAEDVDECIKRLKIEREVKKMTMQNPAPLGTGEHKQAKGSDAPK